MKTTKDVLTAKPRVDIIIPTMDNPQVFSACLTSILSWTSEPFRLILVNNGKPETLYWPRNYPFCTVLQMPENKGWMTAVNAGITWALEHSDSPFICWMNDDVQIIDHDYGWMTKMLHAFQANEKIGAVGPTSNRIMGYQNSGYIGMPPTIEATRLSGMCFLTRKDIVRKIGLLDETLPGGDDLDYSIRMRDAGYKLAIARRVFMLHHYATTGKRVHGEYWDSKEHTEKINNSLIKKHGFRKWWMCVNDQFDTPYEGKGVVEAEEELALRYIQDELEHGKVLDLGCGGKKIDQRCIGVDLRANGEIGVGANVWYPCAGDVQCDVTTLEAFYDASVDAIIAKHLLEHVIDVPKCLESWRKKLKPGGKLVILCPDWRFCEAMACDPSHVHAFTPDACKSLLELCGFRVQHNESVSPGYVFSLTAERLPTEAELLASGSVMAVTA